MKKQIKEVISKSECIYSFLLNLYPKDFKVGYKGLLVQLFRDLLREAYKLNKVKGIWSVWFTVIKDLPFSIINEHLLLVRGDINMKKFWKSFAIIVSSLLALDWALGVGRFYFPILKSFFLVINFPFSILYLYLESKSSTWWFNFLGTQVINDEIAQAILFSFMIIIQAILYTFLFILIRRIIQLKRIHPVKQ